MGNKCTPQKNCTKPEPITNIGYLNFLRALRKSRSDLTPVEVTQLGAKLWQRLSCAQRAKYQQMSCKPQQVMLKASQSSCKRKRRPRRPTRPTRPRRPRRPRRRSCSKSRKSRPRRRSCVKRRKPRRRSCVRRRKPKTRSCARRRRPRPRPRCPRPRKRCAARKKNCVKPGPLTKNGYLNFLRYFRRQNCGLTAQQIARRGGRKWCSMTQHEKDKFNRQACKVTTSKRKLNSPLCRNARLAAEKRKRRC